MTGRVFAVQSFLNSTFLCASWGRIHGSRLASAREIEQKEEKKKWTSSEQAVGSGLTLGRPLLDSITDGELFTHLAPTSVTLVMRFNRLCMLELGGFLFLDTG